MPIGSMVGLQRVAFQTTRPGVLRKNRGFPARFRPGGAGLPPCVVFFQWQNALRLAVVPVGAQDAPPRLAGSFSVPLEDSPAGRDPPCPDRTRDRPYERKTLCPRHPPAPGLDGTLPYGRRTLAEQVPPAGSQNPPRATGCPAVPAGDGRRKPPGAPSLHAPVTGRRKPAPVCKSALPVSGPSLFFS